MEGLPLANETGVPLLVMLSQLTPCHWARVDPGCTVHLPSGRVWFTVSAVLLDEHTVIPTRVCVAAHLTAMAAIATLLPTGPVLGVGSVAVSRTERAVSLSNG
jgi:hypothetical protein